MEASLCTQQALDDQRTIAHQVFALMADMEVVQTEDHVPPGDGIIVSMLTYSHASEGAILVECSRALAYSFTGRLFAIETPTGYDDNVRDAMGELVNMIGGNLKGLMPAETRISTPVLLDRPQRDEVLAANQRLTRFCFTVEGEHCCVSLLEANGTPDRLQLSNSQSKTTDINLEPGGSLGTVSPD